MQFQQSEENLEDADGSIYKVGCVFLMVIWSEFCMGQYRDDHYRDNLPDFRIRIPTVKLKIPGKKHGKSRIPKFCYIQVIVFEPSTSGNGWDLASPQP